MTDKDLKDLDPGNNPRDVQREAKELKPNRELGDERDNLLEREFESTNEHDLESREREHRPLTDPEDNAKVNRVEVSPATARPVVVRPVEARPYLVAPAALRNLFIGSSVAGVLLVVVILTLASSGDRARYTPTDETQYQRTLTEATETLSATEISEDAATARIPIEEAITVVAAQGLGPVSAALAAPPEPPAAGGSEAQAGGEAVAADGQAVYEANCASCHQATGEGAPGAFPPLVGHVPALYNADRSYLIHLLLYGLQGEIVVEGQPYNGLMPAWQQLSDEEIAATLNYISTAWGNEGALQNFEPYEAAEIAAERDAGLSSADVYALRQDLSLSGDE